MNRTVQKLRSHVFICTNERMPNDPRGCCKAKGSEDLLNLFNKAVHDRHLSTEIRVQKAGCLDTCESGPTLVVYPDTIWYGKVRPEDIAEIIESHLIGGIPVERLRIAGK